MRTTARREAAFLAAGRIRHDLDGFAGVVILRPRSRRRLAPLPSSPMLDRFSCAAAAALLLLHAGTAQGVDPIGRVHPKALPLAQVATLAVPAIDRVAISAEDQQRRRNGDAPRFAIPFAVAADPATHGTWEQLDATWSLWRLRLHAPNSSHVNLGIGDFAMPPGARCMVYEANYTDVLRPFDAADHSPTGELWTPIVAGEQIVAEVYVPTTLRPQVRCRIVQVGAGYRFFGAGDDALGAPEGSGSCNIDVVCPQGAPWVAEIPAIAAISTGGSLFCSGSMINNTAQDGRNFFLTAYHCGITSGNAASLVCYWNYRETTCGGGGANLSQFTTGSTWRAGWSTSDFTLVELNSAPNAAWGITHAGWNRGTSNAPSTAATAIHHPSGDAKKISFEYQATAVTSYGGTSVPGNGSHVRVIDWDDGTTEGGSSGSPLFDQNRRIIGQLHGGSAACGNNSSDWYGRFASSWTGGGANTSRLSNWLDPLATGQTTIDTRTPGVYATATSYGTGCYTTWGAFAQTFAASTFDLGGTAITTVTVALQPIANGYTVQAGPNAWFTPVSANLGLGDDAVSAAITLPFSFPYPGGNATQMRMCSNGYLWVGGAQTLADYSPTLAELASGAARFAPAWMDLAPNLGGSCHYDVDPTNTAVYFTWNNVPHYVASGPAPAGNTLQVVLRNTGAVEYRYRAIPSQINTAITGWSRGATVVPPATDISAALPFPVTVDAAGLTFTPANRPVLGTTHTSNLTNVPNPAASAGVVVIDFVPSIPPIDLGPLGAPLCLLYQPASVLQALPPLGVSTPWSLTLPNNPSLASAHVYVQGAAVIPPGTNALGVLTSNGVDLMLGTL